MSKLDSSGPAFPTHDSGSPRGMTLRDYFAAKAMQGLLAWNAEGTKGLGALAYEIADDMLAARDGGA